MRNKIILTGLMSVFSLIINAQALNKFDNDSTTQHSHHEEHSSHDDHDHNAFSDHHEHHRNEIGLAVAPVYFLKEKEVTLGVHFHYVHNIPSSKFGIGVGYEQIFDDHEHKTIGLVGCFRPIDKLAINLAPGLTFEKGSTEPRFAAHFETSYEWEIHNFHIGPAFEIAYDPEDIHLSLGLHLGYGF